MDSIKKIVQILEKMIVAHKQLLTLAQEKRETLVKGNIEELQSIILKESTYADEIQKLENTRIDLVSEYLTGNGKRSEVFTLEEFIQHQDDEETKKTISFYARELRHLVQEIARFNDLNQQLIQTSLAYLQYSMKMYLRKEPSIGYGPNSSSQYLSFLDAKI